MIALAFTSLRGCWFFPLFFCLSILSSVCSPFPISLYLSLVLRDRVLSLLLGCLSIRGGVTDAGFRAGAGLACFGTFLVRDGDVFEFIVFVMGNASISLYGEERLPVLMGGCVESWVVRVSLTVPCNPSRVAGQGFSGCFVFSGSLYTGSISFSLFSTLLSFWG